jgi:hypothetical protein
MQQPPQEQQLQQQQQLKPQQQQHTSTLLPTVLRALIGSSGGHMVSAFFQHVTATASITQLQQLVLALLQCMEDGASTSGDTGCVFTSYGAASISGEHIERIGSDDDRWAYRPPRNILPLAVQLKQAAAIAVLAVCRRQAGVDCLLLPFQQPQQQQPQQRQQQQLLHPPLLQQVIQRVLQVGRILSTLPPGLITTQLVICSRHCGKPTSLQSSSKWQQRCSSCWHRCWDTGNTYAVSVVSSVARVAAARRVV